MERPRPVGLREDRAMADARGPAGAEEGAQGDGTRSTRRLECDRRPRNFVARLSASDTPSRALQAWSAVESMRSPLTASIIAMSLRCYSIGANWMSPVSTRSCRPRHAQAPKRCPHSWYGASRRADGCRGVMPTPTAARKLLGSNRPVSFREDPDAGGPFRCILIVRPAERRSPRRTGRH